MRTVTPEIRKLIRRVKTTGLTQREIAMETGLNYWWVNSFMQGRIPNPGWMKVERLVEFLESHEASNPGDKSGGSPSAIRDRR